MGRPFPLKIALRMGDLDPHLIRGSLGPPSPQPKRHLDRCSRFCRAHSVTDRQTERQAQTDRQTMLLGL